MIIMTIMMIAVLIAVMMVMRMMRMGMMVTPTWQELDMMLVVDGVHLQGRSPLCICICRLTIYLAFLNSWKRWSGNHHTFYILCIKYMRFKMHQNIDSLLLPQFSTSWRLHLKEKGFNEMCSRFPKLNIQHVWSDFGGPVLWSLGH